MGRALAWIWPPLIAELPVFASDDAALINESAHALNQALCDTLGNVRSGEYQFAIGYTATSNGRPEAKAAALACLGRMKPSEARRAVRRYVRLGGPLPSPVAKDQRPGGAGGPASPPDPLNPSPISVVVSIRARGDRDRVT